jgi:hypothetical protein
MRPYSIAIFTALALHALPGHAANLRVLERELALLEMGAEGASAKAALPAGEKRARLQEQADAIRKAVESARRVVVVNVPAYTLTAYEDGEPVLESRVIVGAVDRKTPLTETEVSGVQFNPGWNAPPKVVKGDLTRNGVIDERAVRKKGLTVLDEKGNPLPPEVLGFIPADQSSRLRYYHPPGDGNALGRLKVTLKGMPDIYLHDTPSKALFAKSRRALSSGCVRVEKARDLAAWLTGKSGDEIGRLIDANLTRTVTVEPTKVVLGYWLSDTSGERAIYVDDVYRLAQRRSEPLATVAKVSTGATPSISTEAPKPAPAAPAAPVQAVRSEPTAVEAAAEPAEPAMAVSAAAAPPPAEPKAASAAAAPAAAATVATPARRAVVTPANSAPWLDHYVRSALAGLEMDALRHTVSWQLPVTGAAAVLTLTIDRNGYVRGADLEAVTAGPALRALARQHLERHSRTLPFPDALARDLDELVVPVTLSTVRG